MEPLPPIAPFQSTASLYAQEIEQRVQAMMEQRVNTGAVSAGSTSEITTKDEEEQKEKARAARRNSLALRQAMLASSNVKADATPSKGGALPQDHETDVVEGSFVANPPHVGNNSNMDNELSRAISLDLSAATFAPPAFAVAPLALAHNAVSATSEPPSLDASINSSSDLWHASAFVTVPHVHHNQDCNVVANVGDKQTAISTQPTANQPTAAQPTATATQPTATATQPTVTQPIATQPISEEPRPLSSLSELPPSTPVCPLTPFLPSSPSYCASETFSVPSRSLSLNASKLSWTPGTGSTTQQLLQQASDAINKTYLAIHRLRTHRERYMETMRQSASARASASVPTIIEPTTTSDVSTPTTPNGTVSSLQSKSRGLPLRRNSTSSVRSLGEPGTPSFEFSPSTEAPEWPSVSRLGTQNAATPLSPTGSTALRSRTPSPTPPSPGTRVRTTSLLGPVPASVLQRRHSHAISLSSLPAPIDTRSPAVTVGGTKGGLAIEVIQAPAQRRSSMSAQLVSDGCTPTRMMRAPSRRMSMRETSAGIEGDASEGVDMFDAGVNSGGRSESGIGGGVHVGGAGGSHSSQQRRASSADIGETASRPRTGSIRRPVTGPAARGVVAKT